MTSSPEGSFFFLFRTDRGRVGREVWWRGTVPLVLIAALMTGGWLLLRPYATGDLVNGTLPGAATLLAYVYLAGFAFAMILVAICEYNLSAKRFRDRGRPAALAAVLPLSLLAVGALVGFVPRSFGAMPDWIEPAAVAAVLAVVAWNVADLGFGTSRAAAP